MNIETPTQTLKMNTAQNASASSKTQTPEGSKGFKAEFEELQTKQPAQEITQAEVKAQSQTELQTQNKVSAQKDSQIVNDSQKTPENIIPSEISKQELSINKEQNLSSAQKFVTEQISTENAGKQTAAASAAQAKTVSPDEKETKKVTVEKTNESNLEDELNSLAQTVNQKILHTKEIGTKSKEQPTKDIQKIDYSENIVKMDSNDAQFFLSVTQDGNFSLEKTVSEAVQLTQTQGTEAAQKPVQVSATLLASLEQAAKTNKPLRIDFDKDISVIIKIDRQGKISADFIPGDAAVENYIRNNIPALRQKFDEQGLNYNELSYRQSKQQQRNNKENKDE